jgi:ubiquinone/menaquinone biosynthesis C-methylase UbiE
VTSFPDHFSAVAANYARYRPTYPAALFDWIAANAVATETAWDCGCGSGQASLPLAERFAHVIATDPSAEQIARAPTHPRINWRVATAESSGLDDRSVDVVTVAQALHWFARPRFWDEVRRVARPGGVIAAWTYGMPFDDDPAIAGLVRHFHDVIVGPYWPVERGHVEKRYSSIDFPFTPIDPPPFELRATWTLDQMIGYLGTWSAVRRYIAQRDEDPVAIFAGQLQPVWGVVRTVRWPVTVIAGRA